MLGVIETSLVIINTSTSLALFTQRGLLHDVSSDCLLKSCKSSSELNLIQFEVTWTLGDDTYLLVFSLL